MLDRHSKSSSLPVVLVNTNMQQAMNEYKKRIIGQEDLLIKMLIALLTGGHILLEGVPGLAKTLAIKTFSEILSLSFNRIQFTSDLLPSDIIGTEIYNQKTNAFYIKKGPIFNHVILADEVNRAPSKVQSALLEAMQEKQVTIGNRTFPLEEPYIVMATQNPMDQEGTYPLPEAQVDRFMLKVLVDYPGEEQEVDMVKKVSVSKGTPVTKLFTSTKIKTMMKKVEEVYVDDRLVNYVISLVSATRHPERVNIDKSLITYGASPRASIYLIQAAKAFAFLQGEDFIKTEDIKAIAMDVLRHRIILSYEAEAEELTSEDLIQKVLSQVKTP